MNFGRKIWSDAAKILFDFISFDLIKLKEVVKAKI